MPADRMVDVPVIDKRTATIVADMGESLSLMDSETFLTYDIPKPTDEDIAPKIELNAVVEVWDVMGRKKVVRVKKD
jgi:translation initiation factor 5A